MRAYRLVEIAQVAPAFESKLDAPLVGRKRELAALRKALKRTVDGGTARAAVVIGSPGVGKSRLVTELTRRAKGVTMLWGRCLSYGDGITYWPLRDVLARLHRATSAMRCSQRSMPRLRLQHPRSRGCSGSSARRSHGSSRSCSSSTTSTGPSRPSSSSSSTS